jgi:putative phage-type endonuclease
MSDAAMPPSEDLRSAYTVEDIRQQIAYWQERLAELSGSPTLGDVDTDTAAETDTDSETESDDADDNLFDRLPEEIVLELDNEVMEHIDAWMHSDSVLQMAKPDWSERLVNDVVTLMLDACLASGVVDDVPELALAEEDRVRDDLTTFVAARVDVYLSMGIVPPRSNLSDDDLAIDTDTALQTQITYLRSVQQPAQRTPEWYAFRRTLLSASNAYKALGSEAQRNSLIYEKCATAPGESGGSGGGGKPDDPDAEYGRSVNTESPLHWGQKYEPVTAMVYASMYGAELEEFGCIRHREYPFLGASPDGIVTSSKGTETSAAFGRMVEIKNIVNREITGAPLEAYWVQVQLQLEVCDLEECDFVETRFRELPDADAFAAAAIPSDEKGSETHRYGIILYFLSNTQVGSTPHYVYVPLDLEGGASTPEEGASSPEDRRSTREAWIAAKRAEMRAKDYLLYQTIYWVLDEISVVRVRRNRRWFEAALPVLRETWRTIEHERVHGYAHRAPKRRSAGEAGCLADPSGTQTQGDLGLFNETARPGTERKPYGAPRGFCVVKL